MSAHGSRQRTYAIQGRVLLAAERGCGLSVNDPALPGMLKKDTEVIADSVYLKADCFGPKLDEVTLGLLHG